jgi:hypothetical protein
LLSFLLVLIRLGFISSRRSDEARDSIASRQLLKDRTEAVAGAAACSIGGNALPDPDG